MKKFLSVAAIAVLCVATVNAETLQLRVVGDANTATVHTAGGPVNVYIQGKFTTGDTGGLALWGVNLKNTGTLPEATLNLGDQTKFLVTAPVGIAAYFDRNGGLTNPPGPVPGPTGYSGTNDTTAANGLWQIGGGQNTIGNTDPPAYPTGAVQLGVLNDLAWTNLATGSITVPDLGTNTIVLTLDTGFANTIDAGDVTSPYSVSAATVSIVGALTIDKTVPLPALVSVASKGTSCDLSIPLSGTGSEPRSFGSNTYRQVFTFGGAPTIATIPVLKATTAAPTPVADGNVTCTIVGNTLDCSRVYAPPATYTFDLSGISSGSEQIKIRMLVGDVNASTVTDGTDRAVVIGVWTGAGFSCVTDLNRDGVTNGTDRAMVIGSWTAAVNSAP